MEEDGKCGLTDCPPYWGKIKKLLKKEENPNFQTDIEILG
jgi:hypothetical protein